MTSSDSSPPRSGSLLEALYRGQVPWDLVASFPQHEPAARRRGDDALARLRQLLTARVDPAEVDESGRLPEGLLDELGDRGFHALMLPRGLGGLDLSLYDAFRVIELAASWSMPVAFSLAISNGFGSGSYLPALPDGPLKDMISARVRAGIVSAGADAEMIGTANRHRTTRAVPTDDGTAYLLTGEKVYIGNGPVADLMDVSATLQGEDGEEQVRLFFVDSRSRGFHVSAHHEFMGLRGAAISALRLEGVRVPAEHLMNDSSDGWRMRPEARTEPAPDLAALATLGRTLVIAPTSLAIAKMCLAWQRDFVRRRFVDGRNLGDYDEIQRVVATTAADVFTIDSVAAWGLLALNRADTLPDLTAAKNLTSLTCWRVVDTTLSLLGAEGYETVRSKARRGVAPLPVERAFRDARALRVAGGVDFMVDKWSAESSLASWYYAGQPRHPGGATPDPLRLADSRLSPRCSGHLSFLTEQTRALADTCARLTRDTPQGELFERQRTIRVIGQIGTELLSMTVVLGRAAALAGSEQAAALDLADISCSASRFRLAGLWPQLGDDNDYASISDPWLNHTDLDFLVHDVLPATAPGTDREGLPR
jgi:alkylation response protein AidB-like acyl-CoA dehydrogenase